MNKFQLFNRIKEEVEKKEYKTKELLNESKSNPLLEISKENNKINYFVQWLLRILQYFFVPKPHYMPSFFS